MTSKSPAPATSSSSASTIEVMSPSSALTTFGANACWASLRNRVWSGGSRNKKPGCPNGRAGAPLAMSRWATAEVSRSLDDDGCRSTSPQSRKEENTTRLASGRINGPRSWIRRYSGYGSARVDGSSSCTSKPCDPVAVVMPSLSTWIIPAQHLLAQFVELPCGDRRANLVDEADDEPLVVDRAQR